jgi:hypothetical protein
LALPRTLFAASFPSSSARYLLLIQSSALFNSFPVHLWSTPAAGNRSTDSRPFLLIAIPVICAISVLGIAIGFVLLRRWKRSLVPPPDQLTDFDEPPNQAIDPASRDGSTFGGTLTMPLTLAGDTPAQSLDFDDPNRFSGGRSWGTSIASRDDRFRGGNGVDFNFPL